MTNQKKKCIKKSVQNMMHSTNNHVTIKIYSVNT
uniref:Uncharacterized protein n=1 Tax=Rhizophora mucronata TaxID=61149 RepID=A0A2P2PL81_RHIMU